MERRYGSRRLVVELGDITRVRVDAIVNAANEYLSHGGGVAAAIVRAGGRSIQEESTRLAPVPTGSATITGAGRLPARFVIHAVGPRGGMERADELLASAVRASLELAEERDLRSIAFPAISTGIFGYPLESCARILITEAVAWPGRRETGLEEIRFVLYDEQALAAFTAALEAVPEPEAEPAGKSRSPRGTRAEG